MKITLQQFKKNKNSMISTLIVAIFYLLVTTIIFKDLLFTLGQIGFRHDWTLPVWQLSDLLGNIFSQWQPNYLGGDVGVHPGLFLDLFFGSLGYLGISPALFSKLLIVITLTIASTSCYLLAKKLRISFWPAVIAGLFYSLTPIVFNRIIAGHLSYLVAYSLTPLVVLFFLKSTEFKKTNWRYCCLTALLFIVAGSQIQFFIILTIILLGFCLIGEYKIKMFKTLGMIMVLAVLSQMFWLLPTLTEPEYTQKLIQNAATLEWLKNNSNQLLNTIRLIGYEYDQSIIGNFAYGSLWNFLSYLVPFFSLVAIILNYKNKMAWLLTVLAVIFVFISIGVDWPLGSFYQWAFYQLPLVNLFREVYHWMIIPAFCYSLLMGFLLDYILKATNNTSIKTALTVIISMVLFFYLFPFGQNSKNEVQHFQLPENYQLLNQQLSGDPDDFRVLWLPMTQPIQYDGLNHVGIDPLIQYSPKSTLNQYEFENVAPEPVRNYLQSLFFNPKSDNLDQVLDLLGIGKVIQRNDFSSSYQNVSSYLAVYKELHNGWTQENSSRILDEQTDLSKEEQKVNYTIYTNPNNQPIIYIAQRPKLVDTDLSELIKKDSDAYFFLQQLPNFADIYIEPGNFTNTYGDANKGFTKSLHWWWYNPDFAKVIENGIFAKTSTKIDFTYPLKQAGEFTIFAKFYQHPQGGKIKIRFAGIDQIIDTCVEKNQFTTQKIGTEKLKAENLKVEIENFSGDNLLNALVLKPQVETSSNNLPLYTQTDAAIEFQKTNPTKYSIKIKNTQPFYLVFTDNYNSNWQLKAGENVFDHYKVNGYANAFYIDQTGNFTVDLVYTKQSLYIIGLVISLSTLILVIIFSFVFKNKNENH